MNCGSTSPPNASLEIGLPVDDLIDAKLECAQASFFQVVLQIAHDREAFRHVHAPKGIESPARWLAGVSRLWPCTSLSRATLALRVCLPAGAG